MRLKLRRFIMIAVSVVAITVLIVWKIGCRNQAKYIAGYIAVTEDVPSNSDWMSVIVDPYPLIEVRKQGFLLHDNQHDFSFYNWTTGRLLWRAEPAVPDWGANSPQWMMPGGNGYYGGQSSYAVSLNGQYFASAIHWKDTIRIQLWQSGQLIADSFLPHEYPWRKPLQLDQSYPIILSNSGVLYVTILPMASGDRQYVVVIRKGKVIAYGKCPSPRGLLFPDVDMASFEPYNRLHDSIALYSMIIQHNQLLFEKRFQLAAGPLDQLYRFADKYFDLLGTLNVYSTNGQVVSRGDNQWLCHYYTGNKWVVEQAYGQSNLYRIHNPATDEHWEFVLPSTLTKQRPIAYATTGDDSFTAIDISEDGRYILLVENVQLQLPTGKGHSVPDKISQYLPKRSGYYFRVFERPGTERARQFISNNGFTLSLDKFYLRAHLSPDGHSILVGPGMDEKGQQCYRLYRW